MNLMNTRSFSRYLGKAMIFVLGTALLPAAALGGEWRVTPIKLLFEKGVKSGVVTVINDGNGSLHVQMKAMEWTQDGEGKDQYSETEDLVFFPKMMVLKAKEERVVRVGIRPSSMPEEKTYRLFIEEIPEPAQGGGANIRVAIKFGVPVFVRPSHEEVKGSIEKASMDKAVLTFRVINSGTVHMILDTVSVIGRSRSGNEVFSKEIGGWYVLNGISRLYSLEIPLDECRKLDRIEITAKAGTLSLKGLLHVRETMCAP